jgi:phosphoserine/homoserine phosphotransferase
LRKSSESAWQVEAGTLPPRLEAGLLAARMGCRHSSLLPFRVSSRIQRAVDRILPDWFLDRLDNRGAFTEHSAVKQSIVTLDLEGVLVPEIWIAVAEKTGIKELRRTTRDEPDYDKLMRGRLALLDQHGLKLTDIQNVIGALRPLEGALDFLSDLRSRVQVIILSDTFEQFAAPLMRQLGWPTLLCHRLVVQNDRIVDYALRIPEQKLKAVAALKLLNYRVIAAGDSFNDTAMLSEANVGFLFRAPDNVKKQFPQFQAVENYSDLLELIRREREMSASG